MNNTFSKVVGHICTTTPDEIRTSGGFIGATEANARLNAYFNETGYDRNDPKTVFGELFGLDNVRSFLSKVDAYNATPTGTTTPIVGVRIYNAMSTRPFLTGSDAETLLPDVVIVPVLATGKDLYGSINPQDVKHIIGAADPTDIILSDARPCPNECGDGQDQPGSILLS